MNGVRYFTPTASVTLRPGSFGAAVVPALGRARVTRLIVRSEDEILPRSKPHWGVGRRIREAVEHGAWGAALRYRGDLSIASVMIARRTALMTPGPVPAAIFAPTAVDCGVDLGVVHEGDEMRVEFVNASWRTKRALVMFVAEPMKEMT